MSLKKKFVLEFDEEPAFVYVCEKPGKEQLYINGETPEGWRGLELSTAMDEFPIYKLEAFAVKKK